MTFLIPAAGTIGTAALIAAGTVGTIEATKAVSKAMKTPDLPKPKPTPAVPTPKKAEEAAQKSVLKRRKQRLRTGGRTIFTTPLGATVPEESLAKAKLGE